MPYQDNVTPIRPDIPLPVPAEQNLPVPYQEPRPPTPYYPADWPPRPSRARRFGRYLTFLLLLWGYRFGLVLIHLGAGLAALLQIMLFVEYQVDNPLIWLAALLATSFAHFAAKWGWMRLVQRMAPCDLWLPVP